jgi:hypothetical protein
MQQVMCDHQWVTDTEYVQSDDNPVVAECTDCWAVKTCKEDS